MKAVMITTYWKNSNGGGVKSYVTNLVSALDCKNDLSINVIFREGDDVENYHVVGNKLFFTIKSLFILSKIKPNVIYSQGTWYCLLAGIFYKVSHSNIKLIHTFHTEPSSKLVYWKKLFFQNMLNQCDYTTFVSKSLMEKNKEMLGLKFSNAVVTHAGVPKAKECFHFEKEEFKREHCINKETIVLLSVGLTALKHKADGAKLLIKAIKELRSGYKDIRLILTREGLYSNDLKYFASIENVLDNVIFTGTIDNPLIPLQLCDLYVHTPLGEGGVSIALLEAMAFGKPIVATSVGGIPEAIDDGVNGLLVQPDYIQIAEKIEYLLKNKEIAKMLGHNAKSTAVDKFSWESIANKFMQMSQ
ncbi:glycosyltransferase family 4 protein [Methanolobus sp. WCC5]|uniref:glycosyltransferase family 4 protein n=1 Tax=Methanolobus sp. WCC5 TaxID=3125785 RepID=UPI00324BB709